jgi:hypothetical protein
MGSRLNSEKVDSLAVPAQSPFRLSVFAIYVARVPAAPLIRFLPKAHPFGSPIYVARVPAAPFAGTAIDIRTGHRQRLRSVSFRDLVKSPRLRSTSLLLNVHKIRVDSDNKR